MKKAIVTGANGFIGAALCRELTAQGVEVIAVVRNKTSDISCIEALPNLRIKYCELQKFNTLDAKIEDSNIDALYHLAWEGSSGSLRGDSETQINNIKYTIDTVKICKNLHCKRMVFAASIMEYEIEAVMSADAVPNIGTLYSSAKLASDYMAKAMANSLGIDYIRAVISNVYGPGESSPRLINSSLRKLLAGEHCAFSKGEQLYDFIYITDAAKALVAIGNKGVKNKTYYIGSLNPKPLKDYLCEMKNIVNSDIKIGLGEIPFDGVSLNYNEFCITAVKNDTGFEPVVSFSEGIKNTVAWLKGE